MKKLLFTLLFGLLSYPAVMAQLSDNNTEAINQYFQVNANQPIQAKLVSPKSDPNLGSYVEIVQTGIENNIKINSLQTGDEQMVELRQQRANYFQGQPATQIQTLPPIPRKGCRTAW